MNEYSPDPETTRLIERLIETVRNVDRASLDAVEDPARRVRLKFELDVLWLEAADIGASLMRLGGLPLTQRAAREVRRVSARLCDPLEDTWAVRVPGYQKVQWLP